MQASSTSSPTSSRSSVMRSRLVRLGATYIQIDAPHYPLLLAPETRTFYESRGWTLDQWLSRGIELDNAVMGGFADVTFAIHLCRGNQESRWLVEGDYEPNCPADFQAHRCNAASPRIRRRSVRLVCPAPARPRRQDGGPRIDQHQAAANGGARRPHSSHYGSKPLCAAGTLGAQPPVRLCLFDRWKRAFHRGRKT